MTNRFAAIALYRLHLCRAKLFVAFANHVESRQNLPAGPADLVQTFGDLFVAGRRKPSIHQPSKHDKTTTTANGTMTWRICNRQLPNDVQPSEREQTRHA